MSTFSPASRLDAWNGFLVHDQLSLRKWYSGSRHWNRPFENEPSCFREASGLCRAGNPSILPEGTRKFGSVKYPHARTMRQANDSVFTSYPNFTFHSVPFASRTKIFGWVPVESSRTK